MGASATCTGQMLAAGLARQSGNLGAIKARFAARREAEGGDSEAHSLCVFIPDRVGYSIKNLLTKQAQG